MDTQSYPYILRVNSTTMPAFLSRFVLLVLLSFQQQCPGGIGMVSADGETFFGDTKKTKTKMTKKAASNTNNAGFTGPSHCVRSSGTYQSQRDYCYTCGSRKKSTLGYCWNSQSPQCPPDCDDVQGVGSIGNNQCGEPCDTFLPMDKAPTKVLCVGMGYRWYCFPRGGSCICMNKIFV